MQVQIYTAQSPTEARALADLGVDHVGLTPTAVGLPGQISEQLAAECVVALRGHAVSVALSVSPDVDEIARMVSVVQPDVLHLCAEPGAVPPAAVAELRRRLGEIRIMQAIAMTGPEALDAAREYAAVADFLLLDSVTDAVEGVGAAGVTHDWSISAAIVETVDVPVILAGGLDADNVAEAIAMVRPWGVDSLTRTNRPVEGGGFVKDLDKVADFVRAARDARP